jgi:F0F1-type ATP synthase beta subunit
MVGITEGLAKLQHSVAIHVTRAIKVIFFYGQRFFYVDFFTDLQSSAVMFQELLEIGLRAEY